jgi:hypothetical protein
MNYYYPLCTNDFVFENIFASESVSPICFYKERKFGIDYFFKIPKLHIENAIILFNQPPKFSINQSNTDGVKFLLEIDSKYLDKDSIICVENEKIIAYQKTIYLNKDNFKIYFFSEQEKKITLLKSFNSLPTKGLMKYEDNFYIISENKCKDFSLSYISDISFDKNKFQKEILFDRKFNYFKGLIYGLSVGIISNKSKEEIELNRSLQEITNAFSIIKNRLEHDNQKGTNRHNTPQIFISGINEKLDDAIWQSEKLFLRIFPNKIPTEQDIIDFLVSNNPTLFESNLEAKKYIELRKFDDEIDGTDKYKNLYKHYLSQNGGNSFYKNLRHLIRSYITATYNEREEISYKFKILIFQIDKFISSEFLKNTSDKQFNLKTIKYDFYNNRLSFEKDFHHLTPNEIEEFSTIINILLNNPKFGNGETNKEQILSIVKSVGSNIIKKDGDGEATSLYKYLTNKLTNYPLDAPKSIVMANFVAFVFNIDSIEKLQSYLENKSIEKHWIAISFWCTFNGFAKISKNFVKPIFDTNNELMQRNIDNYLETIFFKQNNLSESQNKLSLLDTSNDKNFYIEYVQNKYNISYEDFYKLVVLKEKNLTQILIPSESKKLTTLYKKWTK